MNILITGGAGFIGSNLSKYLIQRGHKITIVDDFSIGKLSNIKDIQANVIDSKIEDLDNKDFKKTDIVIHLAAQASVPLSIESFYESTSNNLLSSIKIFDIAKEFTIPVIYASSSAVYGNLSIGNDMLDEFEILSPYALDKLTLESYAKLCNKVFSIPSIGFRFFNVYGKNQDPKNPYSGVISIFISQSIEGKDLNVYGGDQTRDFIHVDDLCKIIEISLEKIVDDKESRAEILNLGSGSSISISALANKVNKLTKSRSFINILPALEGDPIRSDGNYEKLIDVLKIPDYAFTSLDEGLLEVIEWIKN